MQDFDRLFFIIFQGIFNTFDALSRVEILGTNLLQIMISFMIANALVSLLIVTNNSSIRASKDSMKKKSHSSYERSNSYVKKNK